MKKRTMAILAALMLVAVIFVATVAVALASVGADGYCPASNDLALSLDPARSTPESEVVISTINIGFPPVVYIDGVQTSYEVLWSNGSPRTATINAPKTPGSYEVSVWTSNDDNCGDYTGSATLVVEGEVAATDPTANAGTGNNGNTVLVNGVPVNTGTVQTPYPAGTPNAETGLEMIIPGLIGSGMIGSGGLLTYLTRRRKQ